MSSDDTNPTGSDSGTGAVSGTGAGSGSGSGADVRAARRAQREAERAARAQRKADAARQRALEAARAGGLFEGMEAAPRPANDKATGGTATDATDATATDATARADEARADEARADEARAGASDPATGSAPAAAGPAASRTDSRPGSAPADPARTRRLTAIVAAVAVALLVVTGLSTWQYLEAREATAAEESIAAAPTQATDAAREIATQMFTYDHRTVDADLAAVRERLTDPALTEFVEQSMPTVAESAKQREASVYATVAAAAPQEVVDSEHVTVLVMLNRMVSSKESPEAASSASRLSLQMARVDGEWKLSKLEAL